MILHHKHWQTRSLGVGATPKGAHWVRFHVMAEFVPVFKKLHFWMNDLGYPRIDKFAAHLVLQEALTNAIRHGHGGDRRKFVRITLIVNPNEVVVEVEDEGQGFTLGKVPSVFAATNRMRGRGLFLMRAYSSWISFSGRGNRVTFGRRRTVREKTIVIAPTESAKE
jgi:anti-sigma regulatory factor (Ser/Thr protein kinase)